MQIDNFQGTPKPNAWALTPLFVFLVSYLAVSIAAGDFYKMPITVAFMLASSVGIIMSKGGKLHNRIDLFCRGAANGNIMLMVLIFILAGAFAQTAKSMGAVDATVNLTMSILPSNLLAAGIFVAACFISVSVGTSVGTIVALAPVAVGIADKAGMPTAFMLGVVVSGAMFGDNLSFISDTTIVATRTQGCNMNDKFKVNIRIALPIAIITAIIYVIMGQGVVTGYEVGKIEWVKVIPYLAVLILALCGMNVIVVLVLGIIFSGIVGIATGSFDAWEWTNSIGNGITSMGELIIVTLLAGGMLEIIRYNGGVSWIIQKLTSHINSKKGAEFSIVGLVGFANICTANNTIALIMAGPIAKDIADKFRIDPRRSASLLDITSCFVQGIIPYGAQLLMASGLGGSSPIEIMGYLYYPYMLGAAAVLAILTNYPRKYAQIQGAINE
jgi:Na+/H+ antiporter NhaC